MTALVPAARLLDRFRRPGQRGREIAGIRGRLAAAAKLPDEDIRDLARRLRVLKTDLSADVEVDACSHCAVGRPEGRYDGGRCCAGQTHEIFDEAEVVALALAGTSPLTLPSPVEEQAGCAFRGPRGCSLPVADRPVVCVHYFCDAALHELAGAGRRGRVEALRAELLAVSEKLRSRLTELSAARSIADPPA